MTSLPSPSLGPPSPVPRTDEVRVLATGLDPLAAATALALADAGVCLLNVADPGRVTTRDARDGPYPAEAEGLARELSLRGLLRRRSPRCAPISAPELFPSAAVPGTVVLHAWAVAGDLAADLTEPPSPEVDPALPTLTVLSDGPCVVRWPVTEWSHRPCRECVVAAVHAARRVARVQPLLPGAPLLPSQDGPDTRLTRTVAAGELAGILLSHALGADPSGFDSGCFDSRGFRASSVAGGAADPEPSPSGPVLCHGLRRIPLETDPACLCSLAFVEP